MPSESIAEQQAMAIAEHHPEKLYSRNKGLLNMSHSQLHDFASTKHKGLPMRVKGARRRGKMARPKDVITGNALRKAVMGSSKAVVNIGRKLGSL